MHLLTLAQTLLVAQVRLGLLLLSATTGRTSACTTPTARSLCSPCSHRGCTHPADPRARLLYFAVATLIAAALGVRAYMTAT